MAARQEVLEGIRSALAGDGPAPPVERAYRKRGIFPPGSPALLDLLEDRTLDYRAGFLRATTDSLPEVVATALAGAGRVIVPSGLDPQWLTRVDAEIVTDDASLDPLALDAMDAVVTACALAMAETGTLVLDGSGDQGRRAITLVPDVHLCVVRAHQVVGTVPEGLARLDPRRPLTFISGPSATSDIELARVEGVHGPRQLTVVLVAGEGTEG